jgi:nuclear transcription Y subunit beta
MAASKSSIVELVREQERLLPIANIGRLMRVPLPNACKIARDAKEIVQECVSEFIGFVTSEASERLAQEKRKTITGDDIMLALQTLGFQDYLPFLKRFLHDYRNTLKSDSHQGPSKKARLAQSDDSQSSATLRIDDIDDSLIPNNLL